MGRWPLLFLWHLKVKAVYCSVILGQFCNKSLWSMKDDQDSITNKKKLVVIAEDDTFYATIFKDKLTHAGLDVLTAENGEIALKMLRDRKPDILLLDLVMPVKDGIETLKEIRADHNL